MEATTATRIVGHEHEAGTGKQTELLRVIERCEYPTIEILAQKTGRTPARIMQSVRSLVKKGLVIERRDPIHGSLWKAKNGKMPTSGYMPFPRPEVVQGASPTPPVLQKAPIFMKNEPEEEEQDEEDDLENDDEADVSFMAAKYKELLEDAKANGWKIEILQASKEFPEVGKITLTCGALAGIPKVV